MKILQEEIKKQNKTKQTMAREGEARSSFRFPKQESVCEKANVLHDVLRVPTRRFDLFP
jgi:hypothetical protein